MEKLHKMLLDIDGSYSDFVAGVMHYAKYKEEHCEELIDFIDNHPEANSSDVLEFVITREDYFDYAEPIGDMNREKLLEMLGITA